MSVKTHCSPMTTMPVGPTHDSPHNSPYNWPVLRRQMAACLLYALLATFVVTGLYYQDRQREWTLRRAEAQHRLNIAFELISREFERVRADTLFLADQSIVRQFVAGEDDNRNAIEREYVNFLRRKTIYDQVRLLDLHGRETVRVNYSEGTPTAVGVDDLQDKSDRYYFQRAQGIADGHVFVSDFDLNLEHGQIERPLKPVIRFVTPVTDENGDRQSFLVLNYLGEWMLRKLGDPALPGHTMLVRREGDYLRAVARDDEWGWLLGHPRSFASQFPEEWRQIADLSNGTLTPNGAFAARRVVLGGAPDDWLPEQDQREPDADAITVVSYLPRDAVFSSSRNLLRRLLFLSGSIFVPFILFTRYWALAAASRDTQATRIAESEEHLRNLSSRLLRIQEDERRAISREIHDDLGQQVTAINVDLNLANRSLGTDDAKAHLERAIRETGGLLESLHNVAKRVRPAVLDDLGLRDAIESHLQEFHTRTKIEVDDQLDFQSAEVPHMVADNVYRLLQEALNNVTKHADASKVTVHIAIDKSPSVPALQMTIQDNGRGFETIEIDSDRHEMKSSSRLGLIGMHERVDLLGGQMEMTSTTNVGTRIAIELPLRDRERKQEQQ